MEHHPVAQKLIDEMGADNCCVFKPTAVQWFQLNQLCKYHVVQDLTEDEIDTLVSGEYSDQLAIAARDPKLKELHKLLNEIFEGDSE